MTSLHHIFNRYSFTRARVSHARHTIVSLTSIHHVCTRLSLASRNRFTHFHSSRLHAPLTRVTQSFQSHPSVTFARASHPRHAIAPTTFLRHVRTCLSTNHFHPPRSRVSLNQSLSSVTLARVSPPRGTLASISFTPVNPSLSRLAGHTVPSGPHIRLSGPMQPAHRAPLHSLCPSYLTRHDSSQTQSDIAVLPQSFVDLGARSNRRASNSVPAVLLIARRCGGGPVVRRCGLIMANTSAQPPLHLLTPSHPSISSLTQRYIALPSFVLLSPFVSTCTGVVQVAAVVVTSQPPCTHSTLFQSSLCSSRLPPLVLVQSSSPPHILLPLSPRRCRRSSWVGSCRPDLNSLSRCLFGSPSCQSPSKVVPCGRERH